MKLLKWLTQYNKFLVSVTMAGIYFLNAFYGVELPIGETEAAIFWMFITSILTFAVPNTKPEVSEEEKDK